MCVSFFYKTSPIFSEVLSSLNLYSAFVSQCSFMYSRASKQSVILSRTLALLCHIFAMSKDILLCHSWGQERCHWHLMHRGQGCCLAFCSEQDSPHSKEYWNISRAEVEKSWYRVFYFYYQVYRICFCPYFMYKGKKLVCIMNKVSDWSKRKCLSVYSWIRVFLID